MILYLLRHGIAEDVPPGGDDAGRRLTARGRARMIAAARGMRALGLVFDVVRTSPLVRAVETAEIVADAYGVALAVERFPALASGVAPAETLRVLRAAAGPEHVLLVGHEPGLSGLVSLVLTGSAGTVALQLKKGGLVSIGLPEPWPSARATVRGALRWMLTPRQVRRLCEGHG